MHSTLLEKRVFYTTEKEFSKCPVLELFSSIKQIENSFAKEYSNF